MMDIVIHDVDHGGCAVITGPQGHRLMLDCGYSIDRPWFPSIAYQSQAITTFMPTNLDEDHLQDFQELLRTTRIESLFSNPSIDARRLLSMKPQGMGLGTAMLHHVLERHGTSTIGNYMHQLGGVSWHAFWNLYGEHFIDTNNLSLAVFVTFANFTILFGGDLEVAGWQALLRLPGFRSRLAEVNVYVASHHGRENGQCEDLFYYMRPSVVVFSDGPIIHETQKTSDWFAQKAAGIPDLTRAPTSLGFPLRRVLTTRKDGTLRISVSNTGAYTILGDTTNSTLADMIPAPNFPSLSGSLKFTGRL